MKWRIDPVRPPGPSPSPTCRSLPTSVIPVHCPASRGGRRGSGSELGVWPVIIATSVRFGKGGACNRRQTARRTRSVSVNLVDRPLYLDRIEPFIDAPVVKVLTGLRRLGKSRLLELVAQRLRNRGIPQERIVHLNFDSLELASIASAQLAGGRGAHRSLDHRLQLPLAVARAGHLHCRPVRLHRGVAAAATTSRSGRSGPPRSTSPPGAMRTSCTFRSPPR